MSYTLNQAARATGKSKSTISTAIKNGRISAIKREDGSWSIEPAELHRIYPPLSDEQDKRTPKSEDTNTENIIRIRELEAKLEGSNQHIKLLEVQTDDLRKRLDQESEERRRLTHILNPPPPATTR